VPDDQHARDDPADEPAPEDEARAAEHRARVAREDRIVELRPDESADDGADRDIPHHLTVLAATLEHGGRDDLPDHEGEEHPQAETGDLEVHHHPYRLLSRECL